jgi:hypothetical protein
MTEEVALQKTLAMTLCWKEPRGSRAGLLPTTSSSAWGRSTEFDKAIEVIEKMA